MENKIPIELKPYTAIAILTFCREFINDNTKGEYRLAAIHEAIDEYEAEVYSKITNEQINDAIAESAVFDLIGKQPSRKN